MSELQHFDKLFDLSGKVAVVTGGSRGLGLHAATAFLRAGAKTVVIVARSLDGEHGIDQAVRRLNSIPSIKGKAVGFAANLASEESTLNFFNEVRKLEDKVDILVANAGATWGGPFETTPDWANQKVLDLNVRGVFNVVKIFLPLLEHAGTAEQPARVIIVSSIAGTTVPHVHETGTIMYAASKAAADHLARNLAVELGRKNITTNSISPGFFPTKLANGLIENLGGSDELGKSNPRGRLGIPEDIAGLMVFLASQASAYINGVNIAVDGGARLSMGRNTKL